MKLGNMDYDVLERFVTQLNAHKVEYIIVGAVGLVLNGLVRATDDADLFVRPTRENLERLRAALRATWEDDRIAQVDFFGEDDLLYAVTYVPPNGEISLDLLPRLGEAFSWEDLDSHWVEFQGTRACIATPRTLRRMKKDTPRLQDQADAQKLLDHFGPEAD